MRKLDIFLNILRQISCNENYQHWTCCIRCLLLPPVLSTPSMVALSTLFYSVSYCKDSFSFGRYRTISIRQNCSKVCIKLNWPILVLFLACGENRGKPSRVPAAFSVNHSILSKLQNLHYMWLTHVSVSGEPGKCVSVCSSTHTPTPIHLSPSLLSVESQTLCYLY